MVLKIIIITIEGYKNRIHTHGHIVHSTFYSFSVRYKRRTKIFTVHKRYERIYCEIPFTAETPTRPHRRGCTIRIIYFLTHRRLRRPSHSNIGRIQNDH